MQPMDISVNKSAKAFLKNKFEAWYASEVIKQFHGKEVQDLEEIDFQAIDMNVQVMKEVGAPWLVELYEYMSENPDIIVNRFVKSGMSKAIDGVIMPNSDEDLELQESELDSDVDEFEDNEDEFEDSQ
uniref:DDE-1 domain-containing protein n=1 Tax=Amphimedon queenslandica TaxID=400682 RepID=A0A1X7V7A2_AMPQE